MSPSDRTRSLPLLRLALVGIALVFAFAGPQVLSQAAPASVSPEPGGIVAGRPAPALGGVGLEDAAIRRDPAEQVAFQDEVAELVAQARLRPRSCGGERFAAARPLRRNLALDVAAAGFALSMGQAGFFDHVAPDGADPGDRARAQGYRGLVSENIAAGHRSPAAVVRAWLRSPGHCAIIMSAGGRGLGVGFARVEESRYGTYWVLSVGTRV